MKKLVVRTITGVLVLIASIFFTYKGSFSLLAFLLFLSNVGLYELNIALKKIGFHQNISLVYIGNSIIMVFAMLKNMPAITGVLIAFSMITFVSYVLAEKGKLEDIMAQLFSLIYISIPFSMMFFLESTLFIWLVYICAWGTDTLAYICGSLFGRHKLIPKVSPKKTVEGAVGGMIGVGLICFVFASAINSTNILSIVFLGMIGSLLGQVGDLCASKLKRLSGLKDYGSIFLGHGGVLDRFDSILFTIPYIYIIYLFI